MCNNGHFQPADIPYCQVQCEIPYQDDNNEIRLTPYQAFYNNGSTISFSCLDGFEINGINSAVCVNGTFGISSYPTCEGSSCPRPVFADGNVEITPNKTEYSYDSEVTFSCSDGSTLIGTDTAKCNQGQFDISVEPSCVSSEINSCDALSVDDSVTVTPAADTYPINATIALSCTNPGKILPPSGQTTKVCQGENRWNPSPVPSCINCQISEDCAGKENNICDQETKLCACPLGLELKGNECVETEAIVTTISLDTEFTTSLLNQSSEEFAELQIEICTAFEITLTKQNTNVKVGFVSCFVISFSSGSVIADVVTVYDTRENVTSEQVTDIIVAESRNQPGENVTLPSLSMNITLDSKVTSEVHEVNYCDDSSFNVCDPTYGVCTYYGGNNYTCACNEKAFNADDISGISCQAVAELNRPNYALIIGLCIGTALGIILGILFLLVVIGSKLTERKTNENRTNHDNYPSPSIRDALPVSTISGNIPSAGRTAEASEENSSDIESITYVEGTTTEEITQDQQLQAIARTIQNMGELLAPIPRASPILEDSRGNVFRPSKRGETMY
ncbi:uncharacterized protein [Apostichopus japonicus]|uniref:uncharacterized protein n=1 Tax=Stichopus japonicus TaxID=307972 RepID=UPI003AB83FF8